MLYVNGTMEYVIQTARQSKKFGERTKLELHFIKTTKLLKQSCLACSLILAQRNVHFRSTTGAYHLAKNSRILGKKSNGTAIFRKFRSEISGIPPEVPLSSGSEQEVGKLFTICTFLLFPVSFPGELLSFQHGGFNAVFVAQLRHV